MTRVHAHAFGRTYALVAGPNCAWSSESGSQGPWPDKVRDRAGLHWKLKHPLQDTKAPREEPHLVVRRTSIPRLRSRSSWRMNGAGFLSGWFGVLCSRSSAQHEKRVIERVRERGAQLHAKRLRGPGYRRVVHFLGRDDHVRWLVIFACKPTCPELHRVIEETILLLDAVACAVAHPRHIEQGLHCRRAVQEAHAAHACSVDVREKRRRMAARVKVHKGSVRGWVCEPVHERGRRPLVEAGEESADHRVSCEHQHHEAPAEL
mmetsp:Transcript_9044/g.28838  ORF Transcript_9044/g.28838 Transcript_9044/m.28838 type:complete len:262 (+) Transcript_9044:602-1387(+)